MKCCKAMNFVVRVDSADGFFICSKISKEDKDMTKVIALANQKGLSLIHISEPTRPY